MRALAAVIVKWLLTLLIMKLKRVTSVDTQKIRPSAVVTAHRLLDRTA